MREEHGPSDHPGWEGRTECGWAFVTVSSRTHPPRCSKPFCSPTYIPTPARNSGAAWKNSRATRPTQWRGSGCGTGAAASLKSSSGAGRTEESRNMGQVTISACQVSAVVCYSP